MLTQHAIRTIRSTLLKRAVIPAFSSMCIPVRSFSTPQKKAKTPWLDFLREHTTSVHETIANPDMFCRQCEQTSNHFACTTVGICGKTSDTACIQDTLMQLARSVGQMVVAAKAAGVPASDLKAAHLWTMNAVFSTMTNVNFTDVASFEHIQAGVAICKALQAKMGTSGPTTLYQELDGLSIEELEAKGHDEYSVPKRQRDMGNDDAFCLNELATYGLKGACAYLSHCHQLGCVSDDIMMGVHQVHAQLNSNEPDLEGLLAACLKVGELNTQVLALLDEGHATKYGAPEPTQVRTTAVEGNCILISGHDMVDLHALLEQTEGTGVNVYTHGEMQPGHSYPGLKKFKHLVGNYGTAWQNQKFEFAGFPGPIVVTTNCVLEPRKVYKNRLYTMNEVGVDGVQHVGPNRDFSSVIAQAKSMKGFPRTIEPPKFYTVGFNHRVVLPMAGQVLDAVKSGDLSRIFVIGGCDGSQWERSYFTELAQGTPANSLILTMGCAKNRIIHDAELLDAKLANGMPRVLDMGQCNDSYSAVVVALELAKALGCTVNDLPLSLAVSHLEQKAAAVLLTLLHLGVKNIRLGPTLPAYLTPNVIKILQENYNLMATGDPVKDLEKMMQGQ